MEKERTPQELHARKQSFILKAVQEGDHKKPLDGISENNRERAVNIGVAYNFGGEPLEVLGDQYGISKERTSKIVKTFIESLYGNSSYELRSSYPLEDLLSKRPESEIIGQRISQGGTRISLRVKEQVTAGARNIEEIEKNTGIPRGSIRDSLRGVIRGWGVDVSHFFPPHEDQEKIEQLKKEEDDKEVQKILDELPPNVIRANLVKRKLRNKIRRDGIFITVGDLTSGVFYYKYTKTGLFFSSLRLSGIPIRRVEYRIRKTGGVQIYYVLLEKHRERALGVLGKDPKLKKYKENPVKIICGQGSDPIPNTYQLQNSGNFRSIGSLFKEMGIPISRNRRFGLHYCDFLTPECRVPVYQYQRGSSRRHYFPIKYSGALKNFLTNRYAGLFRTRLLTNN